jgi:hypothetical protein
MSINQNPTSFIAIKNSLADHFNPGRIVHRYNIQMALIESYFIPEIKLLDYEMAKRKQDMNAQNKFGIKVNRV